MKKNKTSIIEIFYYYIAIAFLLPRGYAEFNTLYKNFSSILIWSATLLIFLYLIFNKIKKNKNQNKSKTNKYIYLYFIAIALISFIQRGLLINGLQKIICYPAIFILTIHAVKEQPKIFLNSICNISLIYLILNLFVLKDFFSLQYHIEFLGHVQMISQYCLLTLFCSLIYLFVYKQKKLRTILIVLISFYTLASTDAAMAALTSAVLVIFFIIYNFKMFHILKINSKKIITIMIIINILVMFLSIRNNIYNHNSIRILDFNGRSYIWIEAIKAIKSRILFGYGIEGIQLKVFWNQWINQIGFNYTHNQILQNFLDGGLIGFILYWKMIYTCCKEIKSITDTKCIVLINSILIVFMVIMILESTSMYCYMYIFIGIINSLPIIIKQNERTEYEHNIKNKI